MESTRRPAAKVAEYIRAAIASLPRQYADRLSNVQFFLRRHPSRYQRQRLERRSGWLYGLYEGVPLTRRGAGYGNADYHLAPPDRITIFWGALTRDFADDGALAEQVRKTVLHEIAHHFGISDAELRKTQVE